MSNLIRPYSASPGTSSARASTKNVRPKTSIPCRDFELKLENIKEENVINTDSFLMPLRSISRIGTARIASARKPSDFSSSRKFSAKSSGESKLSLRLSDLKAEIRRKLSATSNSDVTKITPFSRIAELSDKISSLDLELLSLNSELECQINKQAEANEVEDIAKEEINYLQFQALEFQKKSGRIESARFHRAFSISPVKKRPTTALSSKSPSCNANVNFAKEISNKIIVNLTPCFSSLRPLVHSSTGLLLSKSPSPNISDIGMDILPVSSCRTFEIGRFRHAIGLMKSLSEVPEKQFYRKIVEILMSMFEANVCIFLVNGCNESLFIKAANETATPDFGTASNCWKIGESIFLSNKAFIPLRDSTTGIFAIIQLESSRRITSCDQALLQFVAIQISIKIEIVGILAISSSKSRISALVLEAYSLMTSTNDQELVLNKLVTILRDILQCEACVFQIKHGSRLILHSCDGWDMSTFDVSISAESGPLGKASTGKIISLSSTDLKSETPELRVVYRDTISNLLIAPLMNGDDLLGCIQAVNKGKFGAQLTETESFSKFDEDIIHWWSQLAGIAILHSQTLRNIIAERYRWNKCIDKMLSS